MPLFMDFHQVQRITIEEVKKAHMADKAIQDQYGVKYLQYWVNPEAGTVFCLIEGPDKETCELVHNVAHGNIACAITEVEPGFYKSLMGDRMDLDHGLVRSKDGEMDLGYRTILVVSLVGEVDESDIPQGSKLGVPPWAQELVSQKINDFTGRELNWDTDDCIVSVFNDANQALLCAIHLQEELTRKGLRLLFVRMGLAASQPVTHDGVFFNEAIKLACQLSKTAGTSEIMVSSLVKKLCQDELIRKTPAMRLVDRPTEGFISNLFANIEDASYDQGLTIPGLSQRMGFSQPQFYRKVVSITGRAPNDFLRDLRLEKGLSLLRGKTGNVSQVAMEVGYSNPSYFARCFAKKFGRTPSVV